MRDPSMSASPRSHLREQRNQLNCWLGKAVDCFLLMRRIIALRKQAIFHQPFQAIGQDVGGDPFVGKSQELSIVAPVSEHHIADDDQAPAVAQHLEREVDRAARPLCGARFHKKTRLQEKRLRHAYGFTILISGCIMQADRIERFSLCPDFASIAFRCRSTAIVPAPTRIVPIR
jgi:hypothetical protein